MLKTRSSCWCANWAFHTEQMIAWKAWNSEIFFQDVKSAKMFAGPHGMWPEMSHWFFIGSVTNLLAFLFVMHMPSFIITNQWVVTAFWSQVWKKVSRLKCLNLYATLDCCVEPVTSTVDSSCHKMAADGIWSCIHQLHPPDQVRLWLGWKLCKPGAKMSRIGRKMMSKQQSKQQEQWI